MAGVTIPCAWAIFILLDYFGWKSGTNTTLGVFILSMVVGLFLGCGLKDYIRTGMAILGCVVGTVIGIICTQVFMIESERNVLLTVGILALAGIVSGASMP